MQIRPALQPFKEGLDQAFKKNDPREAHALSQSTLKELAASKPLLEEIILQNLEAPEFFSSQRGNPVIAFDVFQSPQYTLVANTWIPLPGADTNITHQSIHHHGNLLLTSAAAFGEGYESILFKKNFVVDPNTLRANLEVDKFYYNKPGNMEFVDSYAPHVVFYPAGLSITLALWSVEANRKGSALKNLSFIKNHKAQIKKALLALGLGSFFQLNDLQNFDFYVREKSVYLLPNRIKYPTGTNTNFLRALFHALSEFNFSKNDDLIRICNHSQNKNELAPFLEAYLAGQKIENIYEPSHLGIEKVNLDRQEILSAFPALEKGHIV